VPSIEVVSSNDRSPEGTLPGFFRKKLFQSDRVTLSETHIAPGKVSGWHHHGTRELYGVVIAGTIRLEFGPSGATAVEASRGDYFHIPPGLVHRDVNRTGEETVVAAVSIGEGPLTLEVAGP